MIGLSDDWVVEIPGYRVMLINRTLTVLAIVKIRSFAGNPFAEAGHDGLSTIGLLGFEVTGSRLYS